MISRKIAARPSRGRIEKLFRKEQHGKSMVELGREERLECVAGFGIKGDLNAHRLSPRQILVTLQTELDALNIVPGALRENLVISTDFPEAFQPGTKLITEQGVEIQLTMFCEPCQLILPVVSDLGSIFQRRGVLGYVKHGGEIAPGDGILLHPDRHAALPESPYVRFLDFLPTIPAGKVVRYLDVAIAMGVADSFVRALPGYIKRSAGLNIPLHRIVNSHGMLLSSVPHQAAMLSEEGVLVETLTGHGEALRQWVRLEHYLWQG